MQPLRGHTAPVRALAYSPDGGVLASAGDDRTIRLWDRATGEALTTLSGHGDAVRGLAFHPAGKLLYSGSWDGSIYRWAAEQTRGTTLLTHRGQVWTLALSPDGHDLAFNGGNKLQIWSLADDEPRHQLEGHDWPITAVAFAHGSKHVVTAGQDRTLRVWDAYWGRPLNVRTLPDWLHGVGVSPDSRTVASAGGDGLIRLHALPSLESITTLGGHDRDVFAVAFLRGGQSLLSVGADGTLRLWDIATRRERQAFALNLGRLFRLAVAPDGMTAAIAGESNEVLLIDLDFCHL